MHHPYFRNVAESTGNFAQRSSFNGSSRFDLLNGKCSKAEKLYAGNCFRSGKKGSETACSYIMLERRESINRKKRKAFKLEGFQFVYQAERKSNSSEQYFA